MCIQRSTKCRFRCASKSPPPSLLHLKRQHVRPIWSDGKCFCFANCCSHNSNLCFSFRILPHDQDTGGFFVAVLRKVRDLHPPKVQSKPADLQVDDGLDATDLDAEPSPSSGKDTEPKSNGNSGFVAFEFSVDLTCAQAFFRASTPPAKKPKYSGFKEDPFTFLSDTDPWWDTVR